MLDSAGFGFCSEFYIVEKAIEVVVGINGQQETIRIEAVQSGSAQRKYSTHAYIKRNFTLQPTYPQTNSKFDREPERVELWTQYDLPWTDRNSADDALTQALRFLSERCK